MTVDTSLNMIVINNAKTFYHDNTVYIVHIISCLNILKCF